MKDEHVSVWLKKRVLRYPPIQPSPFPAYVVKDGEPDCMNDSCRECKERSTCEACNGVDK